MGGEGDRPVSEFMRDATFIPDTKDILPLLSEMQTAHDQIVVVVDEYGGTAGIITIEDIVEEIVGEIEDEFDPDNKYLTRLSKREWLVDGRFPCDDAIELGWPIEESDEYELVDGRFPCDDAIELGWPIEESDEYETIAGWILDLCDSLPDIGEVFESYGYKFKVQSMRGQRISLIRVIAPLEEPKPSEEERAADVRSGVERAIRLPARYRRGFRVRWVQVQGAVHAWAAHLAHPCDRASRGAQALRGGARRRRSVRSRARDSRARAGERHAVPSGARGREPLAG